MRHRRRLLPAVLAFSVAVLSCGLTACAPRRTREEPEEPPRKVRRPPPPEDEVLAVGIGQNLIYKGQWTRADDLAYTLQPLVEGIYGPAARVVAHGPSNKLFIYIPTPREREAAAGRTAGAGGVPRAPGAPGVGPQGVRTPGVAPPGGTTPSSRSRAASRRVGTSRQQTVP